MEKSQKKIWFTLLYTSNSHNIVDQLNFIKKKKKNLMESAIVHQSIPMPWFEDHHMQNRELKCFLSS